MSKAIVIGASLSGKTALVKRLRDVIDIPISEVDEELAKLNSGIFPEDVDYKHNVVFPKVAELILNKQDILFFTNTDYFTVEQLREAKEKGFKIIQIGVSLNVLKQRNVVRKNSGYDDLEQYLKDMVEYQNDIKERNLVDYVINGEQEVEKVICDLLDILNK